MAEPGVASWRLPGRKTKTCLPCAKAKRRCDKGFPTCQRCADKEVACHYATTRRYARRNVSSVQPASAQPASIQPAAGSSLEDSWFEDFIHDCGSDEEQRAFALNSATTDDARLESPGSQWFSHVETWNIQHTCPDSPPPPVHVSSFRRYIQCIRKWLEQWAKTGSNPFLHRRLYLETGLPQCLQDAFATLAAYLAKNDDNYDIAIQVVEDRANGLIQQQPVDDDTWHPAVPSLGTLEQLGRVQALFIYQFIRLFDGDIRQRAHAEKHIPTLTRWARQLWDSAGLDISAATSPSHGYDDAAAPAASTGNRDDTTLRLWKGWLLAESVRRVWLVANYTQCVYLALRDGEPECSGGVFFTARKGLWEATSASEWAGLAREKDPLFLPCLRTERLFEIEAADVDGFGVVMMTMMWDTDKIDGWLSKSFMRDLLEG